MWLVNEVVNFDGELYRILDNSDGVVVWISVYSKSGMPVAILDFKLAQYVDEERLVRHQDPYEYLKNQEPSSDSVAFRKRDKLFSIIETVVADKGCFDGVERYSRIQRVVEAKGIHKKRVYEALRRYWQRGQTINALLPDYRNCGGLGKSRAEKGTHKIGAPKSSAKERELKLLFQFKRCLTQLSTNIY